MFYKGKKSNLKNNFNNNIKITIKNYMLSSSPYSSLSCLSLLLSILLSSDPILKFIPLQISKIKIKTLPLLIISIPGINIMLLYHLLDHLHLQKLITVMSFYHTILLHHQDKIFKKVTTPGMVRQVVILMEEPMMQDTLLKDMLLLVENALKNKYNNKKVYSMTGTKSLKHTNKPSLIHVLQVIEQHSVMTFK